MADDNTAVVDDFTWESVLEAVAEAPEEPAEPPSAEEPKAPDEGQDVGECEEHECENRLIWSGRGRKPKRCADHRTRTRGATAATKRLTNTRASRAELEADLSREFNAFAIGISKLMPVTGVTMAKRSERTVHALVKLAENNPSLLIALEATAKVASVVDIAESAAAIGVAVMVDTGRMNPDGVMPNMLGVSETFHEINDEPIPEGVQYQAPVETVFEAPVPLRFQKVS